MTALEDEEYGKQWSGGYKYLDLARDLIEQYAEDLARGAWQERRELDYRIADVTPDFDLDRLSIIDLNILRISLYELEFMPYIAPAVTIDQALEIAKRYSTIESPRFINGVLATLASRSFKSDWDPERAPEDPAKEQMERLNALLKIRNAEDARRKALAAAAAEAEAADDSEFEEEESTVGGWRLRSNAEDVEDSDESEELTEDFEELDEPDEADSLELDSPEPDSLEAVDSPTDKESPLTP